MEKMRRTAYAVVRNTEGREWIDLNTIDGLPELSLKKATATDKDIPDWGEGNVINRVIPVSISETLVGVTGKEI